ncbi:MAG: MXAN_5187 C-terminal domain-containing protein, partial [Polyangiaceae bacterium]
PMTAQKPPAPVAAARPAAPPAPKPELPRPAIANSAQKPANPNDLSDTRVRQIYTQYVDTKRKQNESTAAITYEGVAKSLRESSEKLKEKLGGKAVDFEVAVKDGKTILRPKLK